MVQLGKDDLKGRHYPRGYAMWAVQHNKDWVQRIVTLRRSFHQSEPCEDQNKYICQRPAASLEGSESLGKIYYVHCTPISVFCISGTVITVQLTLLKFPN